MLPVLDLSKAETAAIRSITNDRCSEDVILQVLKLAKQQSKGTSIVLTDTSHAERETRRLCKRHARGLSLEKGCSVLNPDWTSVLQQLTSIDGALLVDMEGKCWACGIILDGKAKGRGDMGRGARYNSALNYVRNFVKLHPDHPIVVIVASEDGMINILSNQPRKHNKLQTIVCSTKKR